MNINEQKKLTRENLKKACAWSNIKECTLLDELQCLKKGYCTFCETQIEKEKRLKEYNAMIKRYNEKINLIEDKKLTTKKKEELLKYILSLKKETRDTYLNRLINNNKRG